MPVIYLDAQSTTPVDPRVREAMQPFLTDCFANAASTTHAPGRTARDAVEQARAQVASLIGAEAREIHFTSGATEANNLAIKGVVAASRARGNHLVTVATEHKSVLDVCAALERERREHREGLARVLGTTEAEALDTAEASFRVGARITRLPVNGDGALSLSAFAEALTPDTALASAMFANNEIGILHPVAELAAICVSRGVPLHIDAAQGLATERLDLRAVDADFVSLSAHKFHGPKGVGALFVRERARALRLRPLLAGGGHERGLRSGTLDVAGIVGFGTAAALAEKERDEARAHVQALRDRLLNLLKTHVPQLHVHGALEPRLAGNLNVSFVLVDARVLLERLPSLALSTGSACTAASLEPSHVLRAIGVPNDLARSAVRFGLSRFTTIEEVELAAARLIQGIKALRSEHPAWAMLG